MKRLVSMLSDMNPAEALRRGGNDGRNRRNVCNQAGASVLRRRFISELGFFNIFSAPLRLCGRHLASLLVALCVLPANAGSIRCEGILGNSGADGASLVHLEGTDFPNGGNGAGLAYDRLGALWACGGKKNLMRLSLDGRMLGSYPLKAKQNETKALVLAGDLILIRVGEMLYQLPITAPAGTEPEVMSFKVKEISLNAVDGKVGAVTTDGMVVRLNAADGTAEELGQIKEGDRANAVDLMPDGRVVVDGSWAYQPGKEREELKTKLRGIHQIVGNYVYDFQWHMTVSRRGLDFEPAPGVIYGGSSGYFLGSLPEDGELNFPKGVAHLGGNRFAVVGPVGVIHLVVFSAEKQNFEVVRRIGAVHQPGPMVLDGRGRTWFYSGFWEWTDDPSHIMRGETAFTAREVDGMQGAVLPDGQLVFPYVFREEPSLMHRPFDEDDKRTSSPVKEMSKKPTGLALFMDGKERMALVVDAAGAGVLVNLAANGKVRKSEAGAKLELTGAKPKVTSLGVLADGRFLAADNGAVVLLERQGKTFKELSRWNNWGAGEKEKFGPEISLDVEGSHLWVSDAANNRVVHFTLKDGQASEATVYSGEGLETPLSNPLRIDAAGDRAVVMDWGNQRIVKLTLNNAGAR